MATIINFENRTDNDELSFTTENDVTFTEDDFIEEFLCSIFDMMTDLFEEYGEEQITELVDQMREKYENDINKFVERATMVLEKMKEDYEF